MPRSVITTVPFEKNSTVVRCGGRRSDDSHVPCNALLPPHAVKLKTNNSTTAVAKIFLNIINAPFGKRSCRF